MGGAIPAVRRYFLGTDSFHLPAVFLLVSGSFCCTFAGHFKLNWLGFTGLASAIAGLTLAVRYYVVRFRVATASVRVVR